MGTKKPESKRVRDFEKVGEYKARFRRLSSGELRRRLAFGGLIKEAAIAMRELLQERIEQGL